MPTTRAHLLLGLSLPPALAEFSWTQKSELCARMGDASNVWPDTNAGFKWKFDLHVKFPLTEGADILDKKIRLEWRNPLTIEHVQPQGAVTAVAGGSNWIEVEPTPGYVGHDQFSIEGYRTGGAHDDLVSPTITCSGDTDVPPPSPPKLQADCDLMPELQTYPLGATREAGSDATIKLTRWVPFRIFTLTYFGQEGLLVSKPNGVTLLDNPHYVGDNLITVSFTLDPTPSDGLRCEGHVACIEFEVSPTPHHKPHVECVQSPPPFPPDLPAAPPPIYSPPVTSPSPPSPVVVPPVYSAVAASKSCELGGSAEVLRVAERHGRSEVKIAVKLDTWVEGFIVTLGLMGDDLQPKPAIRATLLDDGPSTIADYSFSFELEEEPEELLAFVAVVEGELFDRIISLSCSPPKVKRSPPSPPPPPLYTLSRGSTATEESYGSDMISSHLEDEEANAEGAESYGASLADTSDRAASPTSSPGQGGSSLMSVVVVISGLGVVGFYAYKSGKLDFLFRASVVRIDGSEDRIDYADEKGAYNDEKPGYGDLSWRQSA
ncbi:hypothetical protein AB1Y20_018681 [Prymnesium parvum]|uniref:Uncharacterized protein n=1 Tax=Prymnesium parvum TaxID=97485 RepID=A0AB34JPF7_PRYPA